MTLWYQDHNDDDNDCEYGDGDKDNTHSGDNININNDIDNCDYIDEDNNDFNHYWYNYSGYHIVFLILLAIPILK